MTRPLLPLALLVLCGLQGCFSSDDEVATWIAEQRAQSRPKVTPLTEPKKFFPEEYVQVGALDPFNPQRLTQALKKESASVGNAALVAPEMARRKEPLEAFPLDSIMMVGSMQRAGEPVALVKIDNLLYQVRVGNHLGQNFGRILKITEVEVQIREVVQDAAGDWIERTASLQLQEKNK